MKIAVKSGGPFFNLVLHIKMSGTTLTYDIIRQECGKDNAGGKADDR